MDTNFEITVTDEDGRTWTKGFDYADIVKLKACYGTKIWGIDVEVLPYGDNPVPYGFDTRKTAFQKEGMRGYA